MDKINLTPVTGALNLSTLNENFEKIEEALNEKVLYRNTPVTTPNHMLNHLDMNGKRIYNLPAPRLLSEPLRVQDVVDAGGQTITLAPDAPDVEINPIGNLPGATNVQEALEQLAQGSGGGGGDVDPTHLSVDYPVNTLPGTPQDNAERLMGFDEYGQPTTYPIGAAGDTLREDLATAEADMGSDLVTRVPRGTTALTLTEVLNGAPLNVKEFGAVGDGVTDDTDAIQAALEATVVQQKSLFFPAGTYMTRGNTFNYTYNASTVIFGEGKLLSVIRHMPGSTGMMFNIANTADPSAIGPNGLLFEKLWFRGNYPDTFQTNSAPYTQTVVNMLTGLVDNFTECRFSHGVIAFQNARGVLNRFDRCVFDKSEYGYRLMGGFATTSDMNFCDLKENYTFGLHVDDGRALYMNGGSIEANGRTGVTSGGVFVGNLTGGGGIPNFLSRGVTLDNVWFEANNGTAAVTLSGGVNTISNCIFAVQTTSPNILISGGQYHLDNILFETEVATHIRETADLTVLLGNTIRRCYVGGSSRKYPNLTVNSDRTWVEWLDAGAGGGSDAPEIEGNNIGAGTGFIYGGYRDETGKRFIDMKSILAEQGLQVENTAETLIMRTKIPSTIERGAILLPTDGGLRVNGSGVPSYGAWNNLSLAGGWSTYPTANAPARFRKELDVVRLSGVVQFTSTPPNETVLGTLPAGFRPSSGVFSGFMAAGGVGIIINSSTGNITVSGATGPAVFLDGITFATT